MFKKRYLSAYITDEKVTVAEFKKILVNEPTSNILKELNENVKSNKSIYDKKGLIGSILNYCVDKMRVSRTDSIILMLNAPAEFRYIFSENSKSVINSIGKVNNVKKLYRIENLVSAQIGAIKWPADDVKKRFLVYSENMKTYVYLMWAGGLVEFTCIKKNFNEINKNDILDGIKSVSSKLTGDIPDRFRKNRNINKFKSSWSEPIDSSVYIIAPNKIKDLLGETIDKYNFIYLDYKDNVVIKGSNEIIKFIK
ncbi:MULTISPECIES: hypothetical protein [Clostridium]|uniref:hypothetical protein n=1 Tax=Clostridium TaxID=1485 RepID=UPI000827029B|nr:MULTISPECIES: hypothetical protein [Clostridium]PJI09542.1 hypothetical protein CUB90_17470 [Clostridium sp. CT7]